MTNSPEIVFAAGNLTLSPIQTTLVNQVCCANVTRVRFIKRHSDQWINGVYINDLLISVNMLSENLVELDTVNSAAPKGVPLSC